MAKKTINVERMGQHSGHPITSAPVPVAESLRKKNVPYYIHENGTIVQSTVDKDGVNNQVFMKSNQAPSFGMIINGQDSTAVKYNPELDYATRKYKPGTPEFKEIAKKTTMYGVPLATYDEAVANLAEVKNQAQHFQLGGEIVRMGIQPKEEFTEAEKQALSDGTFYEEVTYPDGYHVTRMSSGSYGKNQRHPFIYSKMVGPDGSVLYQQDQYRNYPLINKSPKVIDINDVGFNLGNGEAWFDKYKSALDGQNLNSPRTKTNRENDLLEYQKGGEIPSNDQQQQLFVAIITDMAKTLGVEPSQELAEAVMTAFENNDDSEGLLTLFTQTKNKFMNETGLFREGGKMFAFVEKFKCGGKSPKKKTSKKQEGGEVEGAAGYITTPVNDRRARREWRRNNDATRAEARARQNELTNDLMGMGGVSRRQARNSAAAMMMNPQRFAQPQESRILGGVSTPTLNVPAPMLAQPRALELAQPVVEETPSLDDLTFNQAFAASRKSGEKTFMWRGKKYSTMTKEDPEYGKSPSPLGFSLAQDNAERELNNMMYAPNGDTNYYQSYMNNTQPYAAGWSVKTR